MKFCLPSPLYSKVMANWEKILDVLCCVMLFQFAYVVIAEDKEWWFQDLRNCLKLSDLCTVPQCTVQHLKIRARCSYSESGPFLKQSEEKLQMGSDLPGLSLLAAFFKSSGVILDTLSMCAMFTSASARAWTALSLSLSYIFREGNKHAIARSAMSKILFYSWVYHKLQSRKSLLYLIGIFSKYKIFLVA